MALSSLAPSEAEITSCNTSLLTACTRESLAVSRAPEKMDGAWVSRDGERCKGRDAEGRQKGSAPAALRNAVSLVCLRGLLKQRMRCEGR